MQPTLASGIVSCAILVASALATSSWWIAWYRSVGDSSSLGVLIAPLMNGSCSTELISLKVSQYLTLEPYRSSRART
jgi:hypothetical protein